MKINQKGFTPLEIVAVSAVGGMLTVILVPFIFNLLTGPQLIRSNLGAVQEIEQVARSISKDGMMAETVVEAVGGNLTVECVKRTVDIQEHHRSEYYLSGTELKRDHYLNYFDGSSIPESSRTLARYISHLEFSFSEADRVITVVIASTPAGVRERTEQRTYRVHLRPVEGS